jgi:signal transduction histidine kinase
MVPVTLDLTVDQRLPEPVEVAAYYVLAEALTNTAKHAHASHVTVRARTTDDNLHLSIRDNGIGGADHGRGSGLTGLTDRVEALGGHIQILSRTGKGTALHATIPLCTLAVISQRLDSSPRRLLGEHPRPTPKQAWSCGSRPHSVYFM